MHGWSRKNVSTRVQQLVDKHHGGDVARAALFLGISRPDLEEFLGGGPLERSLHVINAVVRRYEIDACWLLTGLDDLRMRGLSADDRLRVARLLSELVEAGIRAREISPERLNTAPWSAA